MDANLEQNNPVDRHIEPEPVPVPVPAPVPAPPSTVDTDKPARNVQQLPGYQILQVLGSGSMAVVYKCRQLSLNRTVAIKVLPKCLSADKEYVERFYQEGQAAAKLNHPNIVGAYDVGQHEGYHYFVMEYVEGKTVDDEIKKKGIYSEADALAIVLQIASALKHAHKQGMIHRDVKPKNIMITADGVAKLMDMGLARTANDADAIEAESGKLMGTPYYISPEQILGKKDVDFSCDIYSLGATLFYMVTGRVPFRGNTPKDVMLKHLKKPPPSPDQYNLNLSFGLSKTIMQMMAKKKEDRFNSTGELIEELQSIEFLIEVDDEHAAPLPKVEHHADTKVQESETEPVKIESPQYVRKVRNPVNVYLMLALGTSILINLLLLLMLFSSKPT